MLERIVSPASQTRRQPAEGTLDLSRDRDKFSSRRRGRVLGELLLFVAGCIGVGGVLATTYRAVDENHAEPQEPLPNPLFQVKLNEHSGNVVVKTWNGHLHEFAVSDQELRVAGCLGNVDRGGFSISKTGDVVFAGDTLTVNRVDGTTLQLSDEGNWDTVEISPDGSWVLARHEDRDWQLWNLATTSRTVLPENSGFRAGRFSPDGECIVLVHADPRLLTERSLNGALVRVYTGLKGQVRDLEYSSEGKRLAAVDVSGCLCVWNRSDGGVVFRRELNHSLMSLTLLPGTREIVVGCCGGQVLVCDSVTGRVRRQWRAHSGIVSDLRLVSSSGCLLSCGFDGWLRLWSLEDLRMLDEVRF